MRTRSKREATALATAKSTAKKMTQDSQRIRELQARNTRRGSSRSPSPAPTSTNITPPQSPYVPGTFGGPRQDTFRSGFKASYAIGHAVHSLKQEDRKDVAKRIVACHARGNAFAADIMKRQLANIFEEERAVWRRQGERDARIALEQMQLLREQRHTTALGDSVVNEGESASGDFDCELMVE